MQHVRAQQRRGREVGKVVDRHAAVRGDPREAARERLWINLRIVPFIPPLFLAVSAVEAPCLASLMHKQHKQLRWVV